jgi:hypothetical protein
MTSALDGGEWLASRPDRFTPGEIALRTYRTGGWVGPRAILDAVEKRKILLLPRIEPQHPSPYPVCTLTELFRLLEVSKGIPVWYVGIHRDNHVRFRGRPARTVPSRVRLLDAGPCVLRSG